MPSTDPQHIAISKSKGITIDWKDGHTSVYGLQYLRDKCPCATCTGAHGAPPATESSSSPFQMYKPAIKMLDVEPVGHYAIRIVWNDGHSTGIYSFEHFRRICPCEECRGNLSPPGR
ncbi:MAG TPA: DUF971 domain-containing protein [Bryobacteraceae bacterium]|nr:DUF971 domain-containing protein [Bryobacteraceae bacterium]